MLDVKFLEQAGYIWKFLDQMIDYLWLKITLVTVDLILLYHNYLPVFNGQLLFIVLHTKGTYRDGYIYLCNVKDL